MKHWNILVAGALLFLFVNATAQNQPKFSKGYVVTLKGDTLKGDIKIPKVGKEHEMFAKVFIKISEADQKSLKAEKVKEYVVDGQHFVVRKFDGDMVFMKKLSSGALNLYEYKYETYVMNDVKVRSEYFIEKDGKEELTKIKSGKLKKQIAEVISDNEELVKQVEASDKLEQDQLVQVVNEYNTWAKKTKG